MSYIKHITSEFIPNYTQKTKQNKKIAFVVSVLYKFIYLTLGSFFFGISGRLIVHHGMITTGVGGKKIQTSL